MESCWSMDFKDLMCMKEYNECKSFIENIANNIQQDEIEKINNQNKNRSR